MIDAAYALLAKVDIDADLILETPSGGRIKLGRTEGGNLRIGCDRSEALWDAFDLLRQLNLVDINAATLERLRSPLLQSVHIEVNGREVILWRPGKLPKIQSARGLLDLLRKK